MIIAVSGSVCTGKSTISRMLARKLNAYYIDVNKFIKENKLREKYIKKLDSYEVDVSKLNKILIKIIKNSRKNLVIDSHLSHYLPGKYINYCIICECDIKILKKRLELRKYNKNKIRENLNAEIFDLCHIEALENKHKVIVVDTTNKTVISCVNEILGEINKSKSL